jgi:hypothetical protein
MCDNSVCTSQETHHFCATKSSRLLLFRETMSVDHVGFCGGQSGAGAGFLRVLRFPLPNFIPPIAPESHPHLSPGFVQ